MFVRAKEVDQTVAVYWDGSPAKVDTLVARSEYFSSPQFTYVPLDPMNPWGLLLNGTPVALGSWIVWPDGYMDPNQIVVIMTDAEFRSRYQITGPAF